MSDSDNARLWIVRKKYRSFLGSNLNRAAARSLASSAAFLVKAKKAILVGSTPLCKASSTLFSSVVVFPVPGGPNIRYIVCLPSIYLMNALLGYSKPFCNGGLGYFLFVN